MLCSMGSKGETSGAARAVTEHEGHHAEPEERRPPPREPPQEELPLPGGGTLGLDRRGTAFGEDGRARHRRRMRGSRYM